MRQNSTGNDDAQITDRQPGKKMLLLGNEAIARGAIEAGVAFATTYPGTPSSEISLNLFQDLPGERPLLRVQHQ
jgi:TPP-dependent indolepyruvate ferredoxin oxidoreductase alpha subunit